MITQKQINVPFKSEIIKQIFVLIISIVMGSNVTAQYFKAGMHTGYGWYQMNDLKTFQKNLASSMSSYHVETVETFPGFINYDAFMEYSTNDFIFLGVDASYCTTGARNHVEDYSGEYRLNFLVNGVSMGLHFKRYSLMEKKFRTFLQFKGGVVRTSLQMNEMFRVYNETAPRGKYKFKSYGAYLEPSVGIMRQLPYNFQVEAGVGYTFNLKSDLHLNEDYERKLQNFDGETIGVNWSGVRFFVGVSFGIPK